MNDELLYEISLLDILSGKIGEAEEHVVAFEEALAKTTGLINDLADAVGKLRDVSGEDGDAEIADANAGVGTSQDADNGGRSSGGVNTLAAYATQDHPISSNSNNAAYDVDEPIQKEITGLAALKQNLDALQSSIESLVSEVQFRLAPVIEILTEDIQDLTYTLQENRFAFLLDANAIEQATEALRKNARASVAITETTSGWEKLKSVIETIKVIKDGFEAAKWIGRGFSSLKGAEAAAPFAEAGVAAATWEVAVPIAVIAASAAAIGVATPTLPPQETSLAPRNDMGVQRPYIPGIPPPEEDKPLSVTNQIREYEENGLNLKKTGISPDEYHEGLTRAYGTPEQKLKLEEKDIIAKHKKFIETRNIDVEEKSLKKSYQGNRKFEGHSEKRTTINVYGGLIHGLTITSGSVKESVPDIKRLVESAIMDALKDAEIQN